NHATLDTGGWLNLTRQGLAPCKKHQASLGALATGKGENKDQRSLDECNQEVRKPDFVYDADKDCFICPAGHILELRNRTGDDKKIYQARSEDCDQCPYRNRCCKSKKGNPRTILTDDKEPLR
ncbi:transposase, partial [bacterium]|nr:transposase [bacterium]